MQNQVNENSVPKTTMQVDESMLPTMHVRGIGPVKTLIDSVGGCEISLDLLPDSIISEMYYKEKENFMLAIREPGKTFYFGCVDLDVSFLGKTVKKLPFAVYNKKDVPVILGKDWIYKSRAILQSNGTNIKVLLGEKKNRKWYSKFFPSLKIVPFYEGYVMAAVDLDCAPIGPVKAWINTGLSNSVIRRELLTDLQLSNLIPTSDTMVSTYWQSKRLKVDGLVSLNVTYEGMTTCVENVRVVSEMDHPSMLLFLGMDWINKSRILIHVKGSKITVSPPQIHDKKCTNKYTKFD